MLTTGVEEGQVGMMVDLPSRLITRHHVRLFEFRWLC
jgi:hypothetical protein